MESNQVNPMQQRQQSLARIVSYLEDQKTLQRFASVVGKGNSGAYINSVIIAVKNDDKLLACTPESIMLTALRAATLRLTCDPALGEAYPVPFKGQAVLVIGYKGLHTLAIRTGRYQSIHVAKIYEGQEVIENQLTGELEIVGNQPRERDEHGKLKAKIIGHMASFQMINKFGGYRKSLYMSTQEIHAHAAKYSPSYNFDSSGWKKEPEKMEAKTVLRLLLRRWGYLDPTDTAVLQELESERNIIDAEAHDIGPQPPDDYQLPAEAQASYPSPEELGIQPPADWSDDEIRILVSAGLAPTTFSAAGMLGLSNLQPGDPADIIKHWGELYRSKRPINAKKGAPTAEQAAAFANEQMPRP